MNDSPGWASPGSDNSETSPDGASDTPGLPEQAGPPAAEGPADTPPEATSPPAQAAGPGTPPPGPGGSVPPNWAASQPPPGEWGQGPTPPPGPGGPVPPPPPGPGAGQPGWGWNGMPAGPHPYYQAPPPPPRPGVIPLRPLGVSDMLEGAFATLRAHWRIVLGISAVVSVLSGIGQILITGFLLRNNPAMKAFSNGTAPSLHDLEQLYKWLLPALGGDALITVLTQGVSTALLILVVSRSVLGRKVTMGEVWADARPWLLRMLGLTILVPLIAFAALALSILPGVVVALAGSPDAGAGVAVLGGLAGMCVLLWLLVSFSLAAPTLMLEKQGVLASLRRSFRLVNGSWWRVFGIELLMLLLVGIATNLAQAPFTAFSGPHDLSNTPNIFSAVSATMTWRFVILAGIGQIIGSTLTLPLSSAVTSLLYMDQRIRREGLDIELARAAGVPGYETR